MSDLKSNIAARINAMGPGQIWVPTNFVQLGNRHAIDKALQHVVLAGDAWEFCNTHCSSGINA